MASTRAGRGKTSKAGAAEALRVDGSSPSILPEEKRGGVDKDGISCSRHTSTEETGTVPVSPVEDDDCGLPFWSTQLESSGTINSWSAVTASASQAPLEYPTPGDSTMPPVKVVVQGFPAVQSSAAASAVSSRDLPEFGREDVRPCDQDKFVAPRWQLRRARRTKAKQMKAGSSRATSHIPSSALGTEAHIFRGRKQIGMAETAACGSVATASASQAPLECPTPGDSAMRPVQVVVQESRAVQSSAAAAVAVSSRNLPEVGREGVRPCDQDGFVAPRWQLRRARRAKAKQTKAGSSRATTRTPSSALGREAGIFRGRKHTGMAEIAACAKGNAWQKAGTELVGSGRRSISSSPTAQAAQGDQGSATEDVACETSAGLLVEQIIISFGDFEPFTVVVTRPNVEAELIRG